MTREDWERQRMATVNALLRAGLGVSDAIRELEVRVPLTLLDASILNRCSSCGVVTEGPAKLALHMAVHS